MMQWLPNVFSTVVWAGVTLYGIARLSAIVDRLVYAAVEKTSDAAAKNVITVPDDLLALAMQQSELWAQEDLLRVIRERYDDLKDWNLVRSAMNIGVLAE